MFTTLRRPDSVPTKPFHGLHLHKLPKDTDRCCLLHIACPKAAVHCTAGNGGANVCGLSRPKGNKEMLV